MKIRIAIDLGGTIEDTWRHKQEWFMRRGIVLGNNSMSRLEIIEKIAGDTGLYLEMAKEVYNNENIISHNLIRGAYEAISCLSSIADIFILTSRSQDKQKITFKWLKINKLTDFICRVIFLGDSGDKTSWCINSGVKYLIDDDIRHLNQLPEDNSLAKIHFRNSQSKIHSKHNNIISFNSWKEIQDYISKNMINEI